MKRVDILLVVIFVLMFVIALYLGALDDMAIRGRE